MAYLETMKHVNLVLLSLEQLDHCVISMMFLQHFTFSHDSVVWNLTFVFAPARSGIWNKKASASMSLSDLVS